jgi:pimeloyl-ACP methyl ester carboxylesterase
LARIATLPVIVSFSATGICALFVSILLETFFFRRLVKVRPEFFPYNRELNAISLVIASIIGGVIALRLARSSSILSIALPEKLQGMIKRDAKDLSAAPVLAAALGMVAILWLLRQVVAENPLTVGWRGYSMNAAAAAVGGSLVARGKIRWIAGLALLIALLVGFGTVRYDSYAYEVVIPSDRTLLRGEVLVPGRRSGVTYPAILLVHDAGCKDRDGTWGVNRPFWELADYLMRHGYVVLRYDKRGCGASGGEFTQSGIQDFAADVVAAAGVLARQDEVQHQPIFAAGHGYGGQVLTIAALDQPQLFAGLMLIATPASPVAELLRYQYRYEQTHLGQPSAAVDAFISNVDEWIEGVSTRRYLNYGDYFGVDGLPENLQALQHDRPLPPVWLRQAMAHDQPTALAALSAPTLIVAGWYDWQVPSGEAETLVDALRTAGRSDWTLLLIAGVNHDLTVVPDIEAGFQLEHDDTYQDTRHPVAPELLNGLTDWLNQRN